MHIQCFCCCPPGTLPSQASPTRDHHIPPSHTRSSLPKSQPLRVPSPTPSYHPSSIHFFYSLFTHSPPSPPPGVLFSSRPHSPLPPPPPPPPPPDPSLLLTRPAPPFPLPPPNFLFPQFLSPFQLGRRRGLPERHRRQGFPRPGGGGADRAPRGQGGGRRGRDQDGARVSPPGRTQSRGGSPRQPDGSLRHALRHRRRRHHGDHRPDRRGGIRHFGPQP